jgi:hypothetical protein
MSDFLIGLALGWFVGLVQAAVIFCRRLDRGSDV